MLVMALADGVPPREIVAEVEAFAEGDRRVDAGADEPPAARRAAHDDLQDRLPAPQPDRRHHEEPARAERARSASPRAVLSDARRDGGPGARGTLPRLGEAARPARSAARLVEFFQTNGFGLPGERSAFPRPASITISATCWAATAPTRRARCRSPPSRRASRRSGRFYLILFAVLIFSAGVNMRPTTEDFTTVGVLGEAGRGRTDVRGDRTRRPREHDLSDKWDYWPVVELPIDEVRRQLNIVHAGLNGGNIP